MVLERTGKSWRDWYLLISSAGVEREQQKKAIAANTHANASWRNLVLITYELDCRKREQYSKPGGYKVSISKTVTATAPNLFSYWSEERLRRRWLGEKKMTVLEATPNRSLQGTWEGGTTTLSVEFHSRDAGKTRVVVQHSKLLSKQVQEMKAFWTKALKDLKAVAQSSSSGS